MLHILLIICSGIVVRSLVRDECLLCFLVRILFWRPTIMLGFVSEKGHLSFQRDLGIVSCCVWHCSFYLRVRESLSLSRV